MIFLVLKGITMISFVTNLPNPEFLMLQIKSLPDRQLLPPNSETGYSFSPRQWLFQDHVRSKLL